MGEARELDWTGRLLYLSAVAGVLLVGAVLLYIICYLTSRRDDRASGGHSGLRARSQPRRGGASITSTSSNLLAAGEQTMYSTLRRSATDSDVVLATAMSTIPLKQLGGKENDIVVDISQRLHMDKAHLGEEEHPCIVCKNRKEITWKQLSCFAQTTISVLVYKRAPEGQAATELNRNLVSALFNERPRTVSTLTLAPIPDSRLNVSACAKSPRSAKSVKSAKSVRSFKSPSNKSIAAQKQ